MPIDYSKSFIYKLCCNDLSITDIYVGSTTNFKNRKAEHKSASKIKNTKVYKFIRDNGNWENWDMVLIDEVNCSCKLELLKKEREYMELYNSTLNQLLPHRTKKQYRIDNYKKIKKKNKTIL